jgi:hypothetical protein
VLACLALVAGCGGGGKDKTTAEKAPAKANSAAATATQLRALSKSVGHAIFWAGPKSGFTYELTRTGDGNIYIRYLPPGVKVGAGTADYLTVGTYPGNDAFGTVTKASKLKGATTKKLTGGGLAVSQKSNPSSVYLSYPGSKLLVEVYAKDPAEASRAVTGGKVRPLR